MSIAPLHDGPWTAADLGSLPDDARYELVDGALIVSPRERNLNATAALRLAWQLRPQLPDGWVAEREVGAHLSARSHVSPDLVVMRSAPTSPTRQIGFDAADLALVVEVESPTSRRRDRLLKPEVYAEAGIACFWRVELEPQPRLLAHVLRDGAYALVADLTGTGAVELLGGTVELDVAVLV